MAATTATETVQKEAKAAQVAPTQESSATHQAAAATPAISSKQVLSVLAAAAKRLNLEHRLASLQRYLQKVRKWIWFWIEELFEVC